VLNEASQKEALARLKKIEGQIKGIQGMVSERRYCIDIINQITAVKRALDSVSMIVVRRHVDSCVRHSMKSSGGADKIDELIKSIYNFVK